MKRNKKLKPRKKEEIFSYSFFFWYENVNLERDNRMRKILRWRVRFSCTTFVLLVVHREEYLRDRKKDSDDCLRLNFLSLFFFFPFRFDSRENVQAHVCRVSRVRVRICVVLRMRESARV